MREQIAEARHKFTHEFSPRQKAGWITVMGATALRPFITAAGTIDYLRNGPSWRAAAIVGIGDLSDLEGGAARLWKVTTNLGGTLDRLSDKISMLPPELALYSTGRLSLGDLAIRTTRDVIVTKIRGNVSNDTSSRSTNFNRASTALRMITNDLCLSPIYNKRFAKTARALHHTSTAVIVASGLRSIARRRRTK